MNSIQTIAAYTLSILLILSALYSWFLLLSRRFKPWMLVPNEAALSMKKAQKWFLTQSLLLLFSGFIAWVRITQLKQGHTDNVIENLVYGLSSLLLFRALGDFKSFGFFRKKGTNEFNQLDKKVLSPLFLLLFLLSLSLLIK